MPGKPNWKNRTLFHGDNLPFLRAMNSNTVHLIATDPPFKKGRDFHATPESLARGASFQDRWSWARDVHQEWADQIKDDNPRLMEAIESARHAHSDGMGAFMCFMSVRLLEMHRILRPDGTMYLHCDYEASHYLKACMDAVFGSQRFLSEIVWRRTGSHNKVRRWAPIHDTILMYSKSDNYTWNELRIPYMRGHVDQYFVSGDSGGYRTNYYGNVLTGSGTRGGESGKMWRGFDPTAKGRHWAIPRAVWEDVEASPTGLSQHEKLDLLYELGVIKIKPGATWPIYEHTVDPTRGPPAPDIWAFQPYTDGTVFGSDDGIDEAVRWLRPREKERYGYPTQKPLRVYERIIAASSNEGDIVLDPFAGCATTPVAAERLEREWVGMDIWNKAHDAVIDRLRSEGILAGPDGVAEDLFPAGEITYTTEAPLRTDEAEVAAPDLQVRLRVREPRPNMSRQEMYEVLLSERGIRCQGCDRVFDDKRYLQLDHNTPRSDGGINDISNRVLLCGPCNNLKSNVYTLSGLRRENAKHGYMARG